MTFAEFQSSLKSAPPPAGLSRPLLALWHDARGDWDAAHTVAQEVDDVDGAWIHAYLHRKEGDPSNAAYWYRRARRPICQDSLDTEWQQIATELLQKS